MGDPQRVQVAHADHHLPDDIRGFRLIQTPILSDQFIQIFALYQLRHNVDMRFGDDALLEEDQQWVRQDRHDAAFVPK